MASLNPLTREVVFKIVFYGPGLGGKTTTLQYVHAATKPEHRGKMVSLATPMDRTLYFDFLPLRIPRVRGMSVRLQLFTVPGQVYYGATRKLVLTGADGIVFVADSQAGREDANRESLEDLVTNLADHNRALVAVPHTFHWNKRDIEGVLPIEDLDRTFNPHGAPSLGTVATRGAGVFEGLERIMRLVMRAYEAELPRAEGGARSDPDEVGIADAIRGLAESPYKPRVTPFAGMRAVRPDGSTPSSLEQIPAPIPRRQSSSDLGSIGTAWGSGVPATSTPPAGTATTSTPPQSPVAASVLAPVSSVAPDGLGVGAPDADPERPVAMNSLSEDPWPRKSPVPPVPAAPAADERVAAPPPAPDPEPERRAPSETPEIDVVKTEDPVSASAERAWELGLTRGAAPDPGGARATGVSFVELWTDSEREAALEVERALGQGDTAAATMACDLLVTRVFASAAGLAGHADAPRDPAVIPLLLGLDGRRYLAFRSLVRVARLGEVVDLRAALDAYAFALEARRARESIFR